MTDQRDIGRGGPRPADGFLGAGFFNPATDRATGETLKPLRWLQEYSLALGIILCIGSIVLIQEKTPMLVLLVAGVGFLGASMAAAVLGPAPRV